MAPDLRQYFRVEASELLEGLGRGLLLLERGEGGAEEIARLFRFAHTLKGASRVVGQTATAEIAHMMEDALAAHRDAGSTPSAPEIREFFRLLDAITADLSELDVQGEIPRPTDRAARAAGTDASMDTMRVELTTMDAFTDALFESEVQVAALRAAAAPLGRVSRLAARLLDRLSADRSALGDEGHRIAEELGAVAAQSHRAVGVRLDAIEQQFLEVRAHSDVMRLAPASSIFPQLERAARDAAATLGLQVALRMVGGEVRLDGHVLASAKEALLHVVRNALSHGIEPAEDRMAANKPAAGQIELRVDHRSGRVVFSCSDDGRGIDVPAVRRAALERRIVSAEELGRLSDAQAMELVLRAGLSTKHATTELSGRGVGLDVVRDTVARCKGKVTLQSEPGRGTRVELEVPVSLSALAVLGARAGEGIAHVPLDAVRCTLRVPANALLHGPAGRAVLVEGEPAPFLPLDEALGTTSVGASTRERWSVIVLEHDGRMIALGADNLLGASEVAIRRLPPAAGHCPAVAGVSFDAEGIPVLVLEPSGLLGLVGAGTSSASRAAAKPERPPILVIDDSLTTRMLEQSILESAGYRVELASSAEEALIKAAARRFGLFIVDVEMPGMNGFEFIAKAKATTAFQSIPIIMVTSLGSTDHRAMGRSAGADAYIVKGEFDQTWFLQRVGELLEAT